MAMTITQFVHAVRGHKRLPDGVTVPATSVRVPSAEGYLLRPVGLDADRELKVDGDQALRMLELPHLQRS